jgi:hypothetical protein
MDILLAGWLGVKQARRSGHAVQPVAGIAYSPPYSLRRQERENTLILPFCVL